MNIDKNEILVIIIAAIVGSVLTMFVQWISSYLIRYRVKKGIEIFLDGIKDTSSKIRSEIPIAKDAILKNNTNNIVLGMHPTFTPEILKSIDISVLRKIYGNKLKEILDIIGILKNLSTRLPYYILNESISHIRQHLESNYEKHSERYPSYEEHIAKCPEIKNIKEYTIKELDCLIPILDDLESNIKTLFS